MILPARFLLLFLTGVATIPIAVARATDPRPVDAPEVGLATVDSLMEAGDYAAAEATARGRLAELERVDGPSSLSAARLLDSLVLLLGRLGRIADPEALTLATRALSAKEEHLGPDHPDLAESLENLSAVLSSHRDFEGARKAAERALSIRQEALGANHPDLAMSYRRLAGALWALGDPDSARVLYERALSGREEAYGPQHRDVAQSLADLARFKAGIPDHPSACRLYERALAITEAEFGPRHPHVPSLLVSLGRELYMCGNMERPRVIFERALVILEEVLGPEHPFTSDCLNNLAVLHAELGDYERARVLLEQALVIAEKTREPDDPELARAIENLGITLLHLGDNEQGRVLLLRALEVREAFYGPDHPRVSLSLYNIATMLEREGQYEAARPLFERVLKIRERALADYPDHPFLAIGRQSLAHVLWNLGEYEAARPLYERAVAALERSLGPDHYDLTVALYYFTLLLLDMEETGPALDLALRGERISQEHLRLTARTLPEGEALKYAFTRSGGLKACLTLAAEGRIPEDLPRVWDAVVRSRASVLDELSRRHQSVFECSNAEVADLYQDFRQAREALAQVAMQGIGDEDPSLYRERLDEARHARDEAERRLAAKSTPFREQTEQAEVSLRDVQAVLPEDVALLAYCRYERKLPRGDHWKPSYLAFLLSPADRRVRVVDLGPAAEIDSLVGAWRLEAARARRAGKNRTGQEEYYRRVGSELRRHVWDPIAEGLGLAHRVFVVPDGDLHLVNLSTLPVGERSFLIEDDLTLHYLSTERDLLAFDRRTAAGRGLLALGAPDFDAGETLAPAVADARERPVSTETYRGPRSACDVAGGSIFPPLPETAGELAELRKLWITGEPAIVLEGSEAGEAALKALSQGRRVIHLATHGFFLGDRCIGQDLMESPLLRSGLALAGANRRDQVPSDQEDGVLTAEEVAALDLSGVEWAVLSACETGLGEVKAGEGVFGLRRAFRIAGARTVITSLWKVTDASVRAWMRRLYEGRFAGGLTTAEAVHRASLHELHACRREGRSNHPVWWGSFIAVGDWR